MSYVCNVCKFHVPPSRPQRKHTFYRKDGSILSEIVVCEECAESLGAGLSIVNLRALLTTLGRLKETRPESPPVLLPLTRTRQPVGFETNGGHRPNDNTPLNATPVCDLCGDPADGGQVTADTVLCPKHAKKARKS